MLSVSPPAHLPTSLHAKPLRARAPGAAMGSDLAPAGATHPHVSRVLYSESVISARVKELGAELSVAYAEKKPVVLQVMCGAFVFAADLCRSMSVPGLQVDCVRASSYGDGTESSGMVKLSGLNSDVSGRHVLLVEDIVDTGLTIEKLKAHLFGLGASSVVVVTLLNKAERRKNGMVPEYVGFECPDEFVVGYGLDYGGKYRELAYIGVMNAEHI